MQLQVSSSLARASDVASRLPRRRSWIGAAGVLLQAALLTAQGGVDAVAGPLGPAHYPKLPPLPPSPEVVPGGGVLHCNGPLINMPPNSGFGGANASVVDGSIGLNAYGYTANAAGATTFTLTDDFTVPNTVDGWNITGVELYGYQTNSTTASTITSARFRIWDGHPSSAASMVLFGDLATDRMTSSAFDNTYRALSTTPTNNQRPIMKVTATAGIALGPGTYWIEWALTGSLASGPFTPPISQPATQVTGNGAQSSTTAGTTTWVQIASGTAPNTYRQGLPFNLLGENASFTGGVPIIGRGGVVLTDLGNGEFDVGGNGNGEVDIELGEGDAPNDVVCIGLDMPCPDGTYRLDLSQYSRDVSTYGAVLQSNKVGSVAQVSVSGYNFNGGPAPFPAGGQVKIYLTLANGDSVERVVANSGALLDLPLAVCSRYMGFDYLCERRCFFLRMISPAANVVVRATNETFAVTSIMICDCSAAPGVKPNRCRLFLANWPFRGGPLVLRGVTIGRGGVFFKGLGPVVMRGTATGLRLTRLDRPGAGLRAEVGTGGATTLRWAPVALTGAPNQATLGLRQVGTRLGVANAQLWDLIGSKSGNNFAWSATSVIGGTFRCVFIRNGSPVQIVNGPVTFTSSAAPLGAAAEDAGALATAVEFPVGAVFQVNGGVVIADRVQVSLLGHGGLVSARTGLEIRTGQIPALEITTAANTVLYGTGCPGTGGGRPTIAVDSVPRFNAAYQIRVGQGLPASICGVMVGFPQPTVAMGGCIVHVANAAATLIAPTDGFGAANASLAIPANPALVGLTLLHQAAVIDPAGALLGVASLSPALEARIAN